MLKVFIGEGADRVELLNDEFRLTFPLLADPDGRVAARYRVARHPHTVIIDRRGLIVGRVEGERDWASSVAREWLGQILGGPS